MIKVVIKAKLKPKPGKTELVDAETLTVYTNRPMEIAGFLRKCGMRKKYTFEMSREV